MSWKDLGWFHGNDDDLQYSNIVYEICDPANFNNLIGMDDSIHIPSVINELKEQVMRIPYFEELIEKLKQEKNDLLHQITQLTINNATGKMHVNKIGSLEQQVSMLKQEIESSILKRNIINNSLANSKTNEQELRNKIDELTNTNKSLNEQFNTTKTGLSKEIAHLDLRINNLDKEFNDANRQNDELKKELEIAHKISDEFQTKINSINSMFENEELRLLQCNDKLHFENVNQAFDLNVLAAKINSLSHIEQQNENLVRSFNESTKQIEQIIKEKDNILEALALTDKENDKLLDENLTLNAELEKEKSYSESLVKKLNRVQFNNDDLKKKHKNYQLF